MEQTSPIQALLQQRTLLQLEYYTEKEAFRKLTEQIGMRRKVKRGDAWFPLRIGKSFYNSLNQKSIEVFRTSDEEIDHNFEFGRPVVFFKSEERSVKSEEFNSSSDDASEGSEEQENSSLFTHHSSLYKEQFVGESFGRINKAEAELTLLTLAEYFTKISKQRVLSESIDVGIISPYRAQVQYLKKLIKKYEFFKPYRRLISVNTVDGFQGQERDVILISLVRSNDEGQIGFLKDLRRMNVAMTRARMKLIILGNKDTMTKHPFYKKLWEYVEAINNHE